MDKSVEYMQCDLCKVTKSDLADAVEDPYGVLFSPDKKKILKATDKFKKVSSYVIPDGTEVICDNAFSECEELEQIFFCNSLKVLGNSAFNCCTKLKIAVLPDSIQQIGSCAFEWCKDMFYIKLPQNITTIRDYTFSGCANLQKIDFPSGVESICNRAFQGCTHLELSEMPKKLKTIGKRAFYLCSSLGYFDFNEGLKEIGEEAFKCADFYDGLIESFCGDSGYLEIPKSVERIAHGAFFECRNLNELKIHRTTSVGGNIVSEDNKEDKQKSILVFID
jgi:hypothetical protein